MYHQRWHAESGCSRHQRRLGSALTTRSTPAQRRELVLRVLTHNLMILKSYLQRISAEQPSLKALAEKKRPRRGETHEAPW